MKVADIRILHIYQGRKGRLRSPYRVTADQVCYHKLDALLCPTGNACCLPRTFASWAERDIQP